MAKVLARLEKKARFCGAAYPMACVEESENFGLHSDATKKGDKIAIRRLETKSVQLLGCFLGHDCGRSTGMVVLHMPRKTSM